MRDIVNKGLIFNIFELSLKENCPLAAVNALHFLPCDFFSTKLSKNIAK